jgi:predicted Zn-dependent protease
MSGPDKSIYYDNKARNSRRRRAPFCRLALLLVLIVSASPCVSAVELPQMGDTSGAIISPEEERQLGEAFMREVRRQLTVIDDPQVTEYIQSLGYRLASQSDHLDHEFTFFIVDNPSINAFAAPGGFIGIHTGLIFASKSESELASVVAHEIAHVTQRHLPRAFEQASNLNVPATAALIAAVILGHGNANLGEAALATTLAAQQQSQINFTRANEQEADRLGIHLVARADLDPRGMPTFFEKLQQTYRFYENNLPEFLSTHPVTESRISDSRSRAETYPERTPDYRSNFYLVRAKLRTLVSQSAIASLDYFEGQVKTGEPATRDADKYGYALALAENGRFAEAHRQLDDLLASAPERTAYLLASARVYFKQERFDKSLSILSDALKIYPNDHALTMAYAESLIQAGRAEQALNVLREHARRKPRDPEVFKLYSRAAGATGRVAEGHEALAEHYYLIGDLTTAIIQLKQVKKLSDKEDFYIQSRVDARLQELETELKLIRN